MRTHAGFTLLEMLVVMAIIALAAATVVPALQRVVAGSVGGCGGP